MTIFIVRLSSEIEDFSSKLIMSDEDHFLLNGHINKQNSWFWGTHNPQLIHETSLYPLKTTVWCGIHAGNIIGPYFFENHQGVEVTVTAERYQRPQQKKKEYDLAIGTWNVRTLVRQRPKRPTRSRYR